MEKNRHNERITIMTALYQIEIFSSKELEYNIDEVLNDQELKSDYITNIVKGVEENKDNIDKKVNKYLKNWNINRLGKTDAAILRLAIFEIENTDTPAKVSINEAINLAKEYSDDKVVGMVNSVLDQVYHEKE